MKTTRDTPDQFIIEHKGWGMGISLIICILASLGLGWVFYALGAENGDGVLMTLGGAIPVMGAIMCGLAFCFFVKRVQVIFDRQAGTITLRTRTVTRYSEEVMDFAQFEHALVQTQTRTNRDRLFRPALMMAGTKVPLLSSYSNSYGARRAVDAINRWAGTQEP